LKTLCKNTIGSYIDFWSFIMQMRQLEAFHAIIVTGTVTKAARKLGISQPSVSRLITDLETNLGFSLFQRKKGRIQPNQDGYDFFKQLNTVYSGIEKLHSFAHTIRTERSGQLRIAFSSALSISLLPKIVMRFQKQWPDVHITLNICSPITILDELQDHETDIGFLNKMVDVPGLIQEPLIEATFICALPPGHALVNEPEIDVQMLDGENLIMLESEGGLTWLPHLEMLRQSGITYKTTLSTPALPNRLWPGAGRCWNWYSRTLFRPPLAIPRRCYQAIQTANVLSFCHRIFRGKATQRTCRKIYNRSSPTPR